MIRFDKAAEVLCEALALDPDGTRVEFLRTGPRSETFRDMHRPAAWAVLMFYRDEIQRHAETFEGGSAEYIEWRRVVEWLDSSLDKDGYARWHQ